MKRIYFFTISLLLFAVVNAQLTTEEFFTKMKNEKVVSDASVDWVNVAPAMSGYNETFVCHPTDPNVMFMGPDMHVSYGTWDNGESWHTIKDFDGNGDDMRRVIDFEFSLQNPDLGYAITLVYDADANSGKLYKTIDKGRSWQFVKRLGKAHNELAIHPEDNQIIFIGAGDFWNVKENHRTQEKPNGVIIGRAEYGHVWKSTDGGVTMKKVATNISNNLDVGRIIFNPINPDKMIMATSHGLFSSSDKGETWAASNTGLPNDLPRDLTSYYNKESGEFILYLAEQTVYEPNNGSISSKGGIYKSIDGGATWVSITGNLGYDLTVITDYTTREAYKKQVGYWFGMSKGDFASSYPNYPSNILSIYNRIVVNPLDKNEIYLCHNKKHDKGFGPGDLWKTEDGGANWFVCARNGKYWIQEENKSYWQAKGNPLGANVEFAHLQHEMDDANETQGNRHLAINSLGEVFIGINQQTLRSNNNGDSWHQIDDIELTPGSKQWISRGASNLPGLYMLHETGIPDRRLMCSGEHALWQTVDIGDYPDKDAVAVEQLEGQVNHGGAHTAKTVAVHPNDPNIIYMMATRQSHRGKMRRSVDGGKTWDNIATIFEASSGISASINQVQSLMCDPVNPDNMYFTSIYSEIGTKNSVSLTKGDYGVYRSNDGGFTWNVSKPDPTEGASVRRITMDPDNPQIIYAALNRYQIDGGLYKSTDGAVSWTKMTIPAEIISVNNVFIDRNTKHILISCGSRSGTYNTGGVWRSKDNGSTWEKIFKAPYVWQAEVSPVNSNIMVVNVPGQIPSLYTEFKNPGVYLSKDAGDSWVKINRGLGNINKINQIKPDPYNESMFWCAAYGSGWFKALIKTDYVKAVCNDTEVMEGEELTLYGIGSIGTQLNYEWTAPDEVSLSSTNKYKTTFTAPDVTKDSTIIVKLKVSNDLYSDTHDININVKYNSDDTAVGDTPVNPIHLYPNPVKDGKLHIHGITGRLDYSIFDLEGKIIISGEIQNNYIDVSHLQPQSYVLKLSTEKNSWAEKFMITNH
ncbi:VPS10 domain-containing protein [Labilibacter marinus]|uniref:VPS10 domain-containing protein n=1 Tax=Labilibacter marinus TaxID=1477105 RepID=UPI00082F5E81|nr:T9SS type A sorting domain-containing protein [Labilibacter marinus]